MEDLNTSHYDKNVYDRGVKEGVMTAVAAALIVEMKMTVLIHVIRVLWIYCIL